jgi:NAD(P)-dependent dehydrogenase (short-subunit alcohol dehydrogenase family)
MSELDGRGALVTGGSRGIGAAIVHRLVAAGAQVVATARNVGRDTPQVHFIPGDLSTNDGAGAIAELALEHLGGVDIIVNNAGGATAYPGGPLAIDADAWQDALDVNFLSAVRLNAALLPQMLDRGSGAIVHIASSAALRVPAPLLHYGASKAALIAYSKGLATELAPRGIRVNTITHGSIQTPGADKTRAEIAAGLGIDPSARVDNIPVEDGSVEPRKLPRPWSTWSPTALGSRWVPTSSSTAASSAGPSGTPESKQWTA